MGTAALVLLFHVPSDRPALRRMNWGPTLQRSAWLFVLFVYMGVSILWSELPAESLKRWLKICGVFLMALVIVCDERPMDALEALLRRVTYVLVPLSLVLIKYFPAVGRTYGRWNGLEMWTGVTTHKNGLGQLCAVATVFLFWSLARSWKARALHANLPRTAGDIAVLGVAVYLLAGPGGAAYSATSIAVTVLGIAIVAALQSPSLARTVIMHLRALAIVVFAFYIAFFEALMEIVSPLLDRNTDLTGRATDIWPVVLDAAERHPITGAGYASAWGFGTELSSKVEVGQAHNGYLDVFLQLGAIGLLLLVAFILSYCGSIRRQAVSGMQWAVFGVFILAAELIYNYTESSFIEYTSYLWTLMMITAVVFGSRERIPHAAPRAKPVVSAPVRPTAPSPSPYARLTRIDIWRGRSPRDVPPARLPPPHRRP
jgi:O-antigen ligase